MARRLNYSDIFAMIGSRVGRLEETRTRLNEERGRRMLDRLNTKEVDNMTQSYVQKRLSKMDGERAKEVSEHMAAFYRAEQRQARKGERIVIVEPCEHDSEDYERGDVFRVDKVDSAGVVTTTGNIVYHEEYEVLPEGAAIGEEVADSVAMLSEAIREVVDDSDNVHSPQHYRQGGVEVIDIIRDAVRDADGFEAVCHANVIKYVLRYRYKNGVEDLRKSRVYLDWLIAELERKQ